ncbi:hypothetical protein QBC47DRAFT_364658 [Echria macrotheca]|uniref:Uncharacterized protein n=1 Tax=Echria macrotheca TaxID=438768 RepID=A0AAJ0B6J8_9PEZI|nr:hypothetical protein QBC47DRAFT_364658 [Echria macrotheca]
MSSQAPKQLFRLELSPVADDGAEYHAALPPVLFPLYVNSELYFEASLRGIAHGKLASGAPATLLILQFVFAALNPTARSHFHSARITLDFAARRNPATHWSARDAFRIAGVSPLGTFAVDPHLYSLTVESRREGSISMDGGLLTGGGAGPGIKVGGYLQRTAAMELTASASVVGAAVVREEDLAMPGEPVRREAVFSLKENPRKDMRRGGGNNGGMASLLRVAVLLERNPLDTQFVMNSRADLWVGPFQDALSKFRRFLAGGPATKAHVFDVAQPGDRDRLRADGIDLNALDEVDLDALSDVITTKGVSNEADRRAPTVTPSTSLRGRSEKVRTRPRHGPLMARMRESSIKRSFPRKAEDLDTYLVDCRVMRGPFSERLEALASSHCSWNLDALTQLACGASKAGEQALGTRMEPLGLQALHKAGGVDAFGAYSSLDDIALS